MASINWPEVARAKSDNRTEVVLTGPDVSKRIEKTGLDPGIFSLHSLTLLEIRGTCLTSLPEDVAKLSGLITLLVIDNQLTCLPQSLSKLTKLKFLDVTRNQLTKLPDLSALTQLRNLNASFNKLVEMPDLRKLPDLMVVDVTGNELTQFPVNLEGMPDKTFLHLQEIKARKNKITKVPWEISKLPLIKVIDLGDNQLTVVPGEMGTCELVHECNLLGNPIKDRKLIKTAEKGLAKAVLKYIREACPREAGNQTQNNEGKKTKKGRQRKNTSGDEGVEKIEDMIRVLRVSENCLVTASEDVKDIRPYIVCCIVKDVHLDGEKFRKFIAAQTKIHENEGEKRSAATIATHDFDKITGKITYRTQAPQKIQIIPLGREKEMTGTEYYSQLQKEAEAHRKLKKRNTYSGVHKYLYLLEKWKAFPYLIDESDTVISLPPLTNCNKTKISPETKNILLEVTSSGSLPICKTVAQALIKEMLQLGLGCSEEGDGLTKRTLTVEQVRIGTPEGELRVVYPSQTDLALDDVTIVRE